jgi:bifunctional DNA-binding transcriptional regulator/antitoxin component of YhaV-PrlF toxin-antitoxin module
MSLAAAPTNRSRARISKGGQLSIPAAIRHRWGTDRVLLEDRGNAVVVRPVPADPFGAARGSLRLPDGLTSDRLRELAMAEDEGIESDRTAGA